MENKFEYAIRNKLRFPYKGTISVEDLWDLSVTELDSIFKVLNKKAKTAEEESLLATKTKEDEALTVQISIIKYIVATKLAEKEAKEKEKEIKAENQKIMSIIAMKEDEELHNMSIEQLKARLK